MQIRVGEAPQMRARLRENQRADAQNWKEFAAVSAHAGNDTARTSARLRGTIRRYVLPGSKEMARRPAHIVERGREVKIVVARGVNGPTARNEATEVINLDGAG